MMKTFFEYFLDEIARKQETGEIESEKAQRWAAEIQAHLRAHARENPTDPVVQMPVRH